MTRFFINIGFLLLLTLSGIISSCKNYNKEIKAADTISMQKTDSAFCSYELIYYEISNGIEYSEKDFKEMDSLGMRYPVGHPDNRTLTIPFPKNNKNTIILQKIVKEIKNNYVVHNNKNKSLYKLYSNCEKSKKSPIKDLSMKTIELFKPSEMYNDHYWSQIGFMNCSGSISFCEKNIVQYTFLFNEVFPNELDKNEEKNEEKNYSIYLAFDTSDNSVIKIRSFIDTKSIESFSLQLNKYVNKAKLEIIKNYQTYFSTNSKHVFKKPNYDLKKVQLQIGINDFSHFTDDGIVFNVNVKDENFLSDEKRYTSNITIPYQEFKEYYDKKSGLYTSLFKQN